jgi:hypothetical protein
MISLSEYTHRNTRLILSLTLLCFFVIVYPVMAGEVTITASGTQTYFRGEEISFSGTNTESGTTYLFMTGPSLPPIGSQIQYPGNPVTDGVSATFQTADVRSDGTWYWTWNTAGSGLDAGTYTIYAVSGPRDRDNLAGVQYQTVSVVIKKPFIEASSSLNGDSLDISGSAVGNPSHGVQIWILGENYAEIRTVPVDQTGSFRFTIPYGTAANPAHGMFSVILQHPMMNDQFDIVRSEINPDYVRNIQTGSDLFPLFGPSARKGSEAAVMLFQALNDPRVDDTYWSMQFGTEPPGAASPGPTSNPLPEHEITPAATSTPNPSSAGIGWIDNIINLIMNWLKEVIPSPSNPENGAGDNYPPPIQTFKPVPTPYPNPTTTFTMVPTITYVPPPKITVKPYSPVPTQYPNPTITINPPPRITYVPPPRFTMAPYRPPSKI